MDDVEEIDNGIEDIFDEYFSGGGSGSGSGSGNGAPTDEDILNLLDQLGYGQRGTRNWKNEESNPINMDNPETQEYNRMVNERNRKIAQQWEDYDKASTAPTMPPYSYYDSNQQMKPATMSPTGVFVNEWGGEVTPKVFTNNREKPGDFIKPTNSVIGYKRTSSSGSISASKNNKPEPGGSGEPKAPKLDMDITASNGRDRKVISTFNEYEINDDIVGAINGGDLPRLYGQTNTRGETIPTMEIKSKDANGNIRTERVGIDKVNAVYFDQMMDVVEQAQDTQGRFDWNKQSYKNKLRDQMALWGLNYDNRDERETLESQLRFISQSKPIVVKNASGQWNYVHMDGSSAPYDTRGTDKSYTVGYKDETTGEFKQLQLSANGENPIMPYDTAAIRQAIRNSNPNLQNVHTLQYSVAPNKDIIRDTFYNGLIPFTMKMLTKQNVAETTTLNISNTPRAKEDITKGTAIIMYRYGLNRIYGRRGR